MIRNACWMKSPFHLKAVSLCLTQNVQEHGKKSSLLAQLFLPPCKILHNYCFSELPVCPLTLLFFFFFFLLWPAFVKREKHFQHTFNNGMVKIKKSSTPTELVWLLLLFLWDPLTLHQISQWYSQATIQNDSLFVCLTVHYVQQSHCACKHTYTDSGPCSHTYTCWPTHTATYCTDTHIMLNVMNRLPPANCSTGWLQVVAFHVTVSH